MTEAGHDGAQSSGQLRALELTAPAPTDVADVSATAPLLRIGRPEPAEAPRPPGFPRDRWWFLIVFLVALTIFVATDTGRIVFDTKLGVDINAQEFLGRLWSLWNPLEWFGSLQDQYIGYAIPMAPFFLAGQLLHIPVWIIERLWLALLIAVGFTGLVRLARALGIGSNTSRLAAGVMFVLWPTFTIAIGSTSAAALPGLVAPWAVLPLIPAAAGRAPAGRAAARSGLAVAAMAGVNAVSTLAVLLLPALYIVTHTSGRRRARLALTWCVAVGAATAWWVIPLLLQGKYSFNFLPYIEQSSTTAATMSAAAVLRGTGTWTAYFDLGGTAWNSAGWALVSSAGAILATAVASAAGLAGLARRDMPDRRWLCLCTGTAAAIALAGYFGPAGGAFHAGVDSLLDGALAPFRSTYKFEPVIAVALALGCGHVLERCWRQTWRVGPVSLGASAALAPVVGLVLIGLALPQLTDKALQPGSFTSIPRYWYQTTDYLAAHSPRETALVVPANPHGQFTWGDTIDDPLEPLASSPWVERGLVPFGGAGSQVLLQTAEQAIESGQQVAGLADYLARAGIRYVVVRNDTNPDVSGYTAPQVVNETLTQSGFHVAAAFGPPVSAAPGYPNTAGEAAGFSAAYPSIQIFTANRPDLRPDSPVTTLPVSSTVLVNGGPDSLLQLAGQDIIGGQPAVIAGQPLAGRPALWAVTDGQRRADNDFGATSNYVSYTYTATGTNPVDDPLGAGGSQPRQLLPVPAAGHQTVAVLAGAASVTASSAGTWTSESTQYDPANAFDGNPATAWAEANPDTPVGQWIQINFRRSVDLPAQAGIKLLDDSGARAIASQLLVTSAAGEASTDTVSTGARQALQLPPGPTRWLRITITAASNVVPGYPGAGITDVLIPGVRVTSFLAPAEDPAGDTAPAVAYSFAQAAPSPGNAGATASGGLDRLFATPAAERMTARITAVPEPGPALTDLIARLTPVTRREFAASVSSTWESMPAFGPDDLFGPDNRSGPAARQPWLAGANDLSPTLAVSWQGRRTISKLVIQPALGLAAAPTRVLVGSPAGIRSATIGLGGVVRVSPPLRTDRLYLTFSSTSGSVAGNVEAGQPAQLPVGLARVSIPALAGLHLAAPRPTAQFRLGCGQGPAITVDGRRYQTAVTGTIGHLLQLKPVELHLCAPKGALTLPAGSQRLTTAPSRSFAITSLGLVSQPATSAAATAATPARRVSVLRWDDDSRTLSIGPGQRSYVEIHENFNPGWTASLDGRTLTAATLDGWQQAFIVPAGAGGTITLTFGPAAVYHAGIVVSALALLVLAGVALGGGWRRRWRRGIALARSSAPVGPSLPASWLAGPGTSRQNSGPARPPGEQPSPGSGLESGRDSQPDQDAAPDRDVEAEHDPAPDRDVEAEQDPAPDRDVEAEQGPAPDPAPHQNPTASRIRPPFGPAPQRPTTLASAAHPNGRHRPAGRGQSPGPNGPRLGGRVSASALARLIPVTLVIFLAGGPVAIAVPVLALIDRWRARWMPLIAAAAMFLAGVVCASATTPTGGGSGPFSAPAQVLALVALAAALLPAITPPPAPATQDPATRELATQDPATQDPATDEAIEPAPATGEPTAPEPAAKEPAGPEPPAKEPDGPEPAAKEPAGPEPPAKEPAGPEPVTP
jgi:arabinofuranan 3-O-arabinosyltransferase